MRKPIILASAILVILAAIAFLASPSRRADETSSPAAAPDSIACPDSTGWARCVARETLREIDRIPPH